MELWREGRVAEALQHLMTATRDPELRFYAARQVSQMGEYALKVLYQGLWHQEEVIQRQSAVILGWIGEPDAVEPLLLRMRLPDAPLEVEYALRKIGNLTSGQLLSILQDQDLSHSRLLDRKTASLARLADGLRLAIDPVPLLEWVESIETVKGSELEEQPFGHLANARLNILRFLAARKVSHVAGPLVRSFLSGAEEANLAIAGALIRLGNASLLPLEAAFGSEETPSLRALIAVTHYLASGAAELSSSGPISVVLNEARSDPDVARQIASCAGWFSLEPNPLLGWFQHHPDAEVRGALAPDLPVETIRSRQGLKSFFLEKTRDANPEVAVAHVDFVSKYLPDPEVEARLEEILSSRHELAPLREAALEVSARWGRSRLLRALLERPSEPLRSKAVELCARRTEPELVAGTLAILREADPSDAKRAAIQVAAGQWRRSEAEAPLLEILRLGDPLWREAARGLAVLGSTEAVEYFVALVDAGRKIDPQEAGVIYFSLTGIPSRLTGTRPGSHRFEPLELAPRPPRDKVLVLLRERSDYRGWVKVEERWEGARMFRLDEAREELVLYDRQLFDRVVGGAGIILLEDTVRQTVLNPLELSETREQKAEALDSLPVFPFAGFSGDELWLVYRGRWGRVSPGQDLRDESGIGGWGRSALVPVGFMDRERIRWDPSPPPSGWLRDQAQPVHEWGK